MNKKQIIGIVIFIAIILGVVLYKVFSTGDISTPSNLTTIYVATGGGKEDFLSDEDIKKILEEKYNLNVVYDTWSNGKTITMPLIRESVNQGNQDIINYVRINMRVHVENLLIDTIFTGHPVEPLILVKIMVLFIFVVLF